MEPKDAAREAVRYVGLASPESEVIAELAEFGADLDQCIDALDRAGGVDSAEDDEEFDWQLRDHLVNSALIAYWRCFMTSGRKNLAHYVALPESMVPLHEKSKLFRNRSVAHADSGTRQSSVNLWLDRAGDSVRLVQVVPVIQSVSAPGDFVEAMLEHAEAVRTLVFHEEVRRCEQLAAQLAESDLRQLWDDPSEAIEILGTWEPHAPRRRG